MSFLQKRNRIHENYKKENNNNNSDSDNISSNNSDNTHVHTSIDSETIWVISDQNAETWEFDIKAEIILKEGWERGKSTQNALRERRENEKMRIKIN